MIARCKFCGREFITFPSYIKRRPNGGICSKACPSRPTLRHCAVCRRELAPSHVAAVCSEACRLERRLNQQERAFKAHVPILSPFACWEWQGALNHATGYGRARWNGGYESTHRVAWIRANGREIPNGLCVLHRCDNRRCVNPAHLFLGTQGDNNRDRHAKGRDGAGWAGRTHCKRGHALTPDNIYTKRSDGRRQCRACKRLQERARRSRREVTHAA